MVLLTRIILFDPHACVRCFITYFFVTHLVGGKRRYERKGRLLKSEKGNCKVKLLAHQNNFQMLLFDNLFLQLFAQDDMMEIYAYIIQVSELKKKMTNVPFQICANEWEVHTFACYNTYCSSAAPKNTRGNPPGG